MEVPHLVVQRFTFALHLLVTILAWVGPFLFSWWLLALAYGAVQVQFWVFRACLLNKHHGLEEAGNVTFYSHLFAEMGIPHNPLWVKRVVRNGLYPFLGAWAWLWQVVLNHPPLLF
jgi:hypothetical protein